MPLHMISLRNTGLLFGEIFALDVECPRHGSEFNLETGEPATLPATAPVPVYEVEIDNGEVFLTVEERSDG